jgi:hypothetical protein
MLDLVPWPHAADTLILQARNMILVLRELVLHPLDFCTTCINFKQECHPTRLRDPSPQLDHPSVRESREEGYVFRFQDFYCLSPIKSGRSLSKLGLATMGGG